MTEIKLAHTLTLDTVKESFSILPFTHRNENGLYLRPSLRPLGETRDITINSSAVTRVTPEAITFLAALIWWIKKEVRGPFSFSAEPSLLLRELGFETNLSVNDKRLPPLAPKTEANGDTMQPVIQLNVPRPEAGDPVSLIQARKKIEELAEELLEAVKVIPGHISHTVITQKAIAEFIWESLLNIGEHAYSLPEHQAPLWISASYKSMKSACAIFSPGSGGPNSKSTELEWHEFHLDRGAEGVLEISISDAGIGVVQSLGNSYLDNSAQRRSSSSQTGRKRFWSLYEEILLWALSPYGSRKHASEYPSPVLARGWRGLYRIWYRLRRVDGFLCINSGLGRVGTASFRGEQAHLQRSLSSLAIKKSSSLGVHPSEVPWPGTSLTMRLALPIELPEERIAGERIDRPLEVQTVIFVPPDKRPLPKLSRSVDSIFLYSEYLGSMLAKHLDQMHKEQTAKRKFKEHLKFIAVVHPGIYLAASKSYQQMNRESHSRVALVQNEAVAATRLADLFRAQSLPGVVFVHILLGVTKPVIEIAQDLIAAGQRDASPDSSGNYTEHDSPNLTGIVLADGSLAWLLNISNTKEVLALIDGGYLTSQPNSAPPDWWLELESLYPGATLRIQDENTGESRLAFALPTKASGTLIRRCLQGLIPNLAKAELDRIDDDSDISWYWKREDEFVRTEGGFLVSQFMSVYALCTREPVVSEFISLAIIDLVRSFALPGQRVLVVPERRAASYLVAKHLLAERETEFSIKVVHADEVGSVYKRSDCIVLFKDSIFTDSSSRELIQELGGDACVSGLLVCADLRHLGEKAGDGIPVKSVFRWQFPKPDEGIEGAARKNIHTVDPLTNEILPSGFQEQIEALLSMEWKPLGNSQPRMAISEFFWEEMLFSYGLQFLNGSFHIASYDAAPLFKNYLFIEDMARWIAAIIHEEEKYGKSFDLIFLARDAFAASIDFSAMLTALMFECRANMSNWSGDISWGTLATARRSGRQLIRRYQKSLQDSVQPFGGAQLSLFGPETTVPPRPIVIFYIDDAAVTGRSIKDVIFLLNRSGLANLRAIYACPLVNKLSPGDEEIFNHLELLRSDLGNKNQRVNHIRFSFYSMVQLRTNVYRSIEEAHIFQFLSKLVEEIPNLDHAELNLWGDKIKAKLDSLDRKSGSILMQAPLAGTEIRLSISIDSYFLRHLLSLQREAFPVMEKVVEVCLKMLRLKDTSLLTVFAVEPDLLDAPPMGGVFAGEITLMALETLGRCDIESATRINALSVLFFQGAPFINYASRIASFCLDCEELLAPWLALILAGLSGEDKSKAVFSLLEANESTEGKLLSGNDDLLDRLRAEYRRPSLGTPQSPRQAESAICEIIRTGRAHHSTKLFGAWWRLHTVAQAIAVTSQYKPVPRDLSESTFDEAEEFLITYVVPAIQGLSLLHKRRSRIEAEKLLRFVDDAPRVFQTARRIAQGVLAGSLPPSSFENAWNNVRLASLVRSIDGLFCQSPQCILGECDKEKFGPIDYMLPEFVQEPIGLFLHTIEQELGPEIEFSLSIAVTGEAPYELDLVGSLSDHLDRLHSGWTVVARVPLLWNISKEIRRVASILLGNVKVHGLPETLHLSFQIDGDRLSLRVSNMQNEQSSAGLGSGIPMVSDLIHKIGGDFLVEDGPAVFAVNLMLPVRWLYLPNL